MVVSSAGGPSQPGLAKPDYDEKSDDYGFRYPWAYEPKETDPLTAGLNRQVDEVKGKMQQNIGAVMERGAHLKDLEGKAEQLRVDAEEFKTTAKDLEERKLPPSKWWIVLLVVFGIFLVIAILVIIAISTALGLKK